VGLTEILFIIVLGVLLLGPKRLPAILGSMARAKAQLEEATQSFKSQLERELKSQIPGEKTESSQEPVGTSESAP
jgi:Sec-independent protein translocase protein TatA